MSTYLGKWRLVPELSHYSEGVSPLEATYEISEDDGRLAFEIWWQPVEGEAQSISFSGPVDGSIEIGEAIAHRIIVVSERQLDSEALVGESVMASASRRVSADGRLMSVLQENGDGNGGLVNVYQVYARAE